MTTPTGSTRRPGRRAGIACALGGFLLAGIALAPSLAGIRAFLPADYWLQTVPFALGGRPPALRDFDSNSLLGDQAVIYSPQFWVVREGLRQGAFPLWNPYFRAGEPMLGTGLAGPLAPTNWPILWLTWPLGHAWAAWLRFGLMWAGAYLLGRSLRLGRAWSTALAASFCFAPGFIVHFQQQPRAIAHMGLPWLLWSIERFAAVASASGRAMLRRAIPIALVAAATGIAGYPPAEFNVLFAGALYLALRLPWRPAGRAIAARAVGALAFAAGLALAAPVLLPFADFLLASATFLDRAEQGQWVLPREVYSLLWDPFALGSPLSHASHGWSGTYNFEEEQIYVGLLPWVLLAAGLLRLARGRMRLAREDALRIASLAAVALVAASLGLGWWPLHGWLTRVPPFTNASNPRMLFLAEVMIPAIAALLWSAAPRGATTARPRGAPAAVLIAATALGAAALVWLAIGGHWATRPWIALATAACLLASDRVAASSGARRAVAVLIPVVLLADVALVYVGYHPQVPREWANPARARHVLPDAIFSAPYPRVAFDSSAAPNLSALYGVVDVRGYGYPVPRRYDAYMREAVGLANPATLEPVELARPEVIAGIERTCTRWLLTTREYGAEWAGRVDPEWHHGRLHLYALPRAVPCAAWHANAEIERAPDLERAIPRVREGLAREPEPIVVELLGEEQRAPQPPSGGIAAKIERPRMDRLDVALETPGPSDGWIVVRESYDPGWAAFSEAGRRLRVAPAQVRFLAVEVPAGTRSVALRYVPPHWDVGWALACGSLAVIFTGALWSRRAGSAPPAPPAP